MELRYYERNNKIILFGAGVYAKKYKALLEYIDLDFDFFTDNDSSKWGKILYGRKVISPHKLLEFTDCRIIISCTHEIAIKKQLLNMGLQDNILELDELYEICEQKRKSIQFDHKLNDKETIMVDMYEGIGWGGSELWAADLAYNIKGRGKEVYLLGGKEQPLLEAQYEEITLRISEEDTISKMVDLFTKNLPLVFINNFAGCGFLAAALLKRRYPDKIKIISVIHNDNKALYDAHMLMEKYIDKIFCVSALIKDHMVNIYGKKNKQYFFKEQPIPIEADFGITKFGVIKDTLKIGYAGRLVIQQKRVDLLPKLIMELEKKDIEYELQIAGDGEHFSVLKEFINDENLSSKIHLLGRVKKSEMSNFWKSQDIFINISEYEGTSLSMLEAMSYGCVPVVTDVSGAMEFITNNENGYICDVGDLKAMAECIKILVEDRGKLADYGKKCRQIIIDRCNPEEYIDYWLENLLP